MVYKDRVIFTLIKKGGKNGEKKAIMYFSYHPYLFNINC